MATKFIHHKLGRLDRGTQILVHLSGNAANVMLLDDSNFRKYRLGQKCNGYGGLAKRSPIPFVTPRSGNWHVAVDMRGLRGRVESRIEIQPKPLPPIRAYQSVSAERIAEAVDIKGGEGATSYDVFISHASEDKAEVVRPLAEQLRTMGLRVWYDEFEMRVGDSLIRKIDHGISNSRFGLVVLSPSFIGKGWTEYELDGMVSNQVKGRQRILPIWHDLSSEDVLEYSASLADKVALSTAYDTVDRIAEKVFDAISVC